MSGSLQDAIQQYLNKGYQIAEQLSPTSVTLVKKRLIGRKDAHRLDFDMINGIDRANC